VFKMIRKALPGDEVIKSAGGLDSNRGLISAMGGGLGGGGLYFTRKEGGGTAGCQNSHRNAVFTSSEGGKLEECGGDFKHCKDLGV